jgi:hypothetical protein
MLFDIPVFIVKSYKILQIKSKEAILTPQKCERKQQAYQKKNLEYKKWVRYQKRECVTVVLWL